MAKRARHLPPLSNPHDRHAAASPLPLRVQRAGIAIFVAAIVAVIGFALTDHWRRSTFGFGLALLWLAALRLTCDGDVLGVLSVRSRKFDAIFSATTGTILAYLAFSVDALGS